MLKKTKKKSTIMCLVMHGERQQAAGAAVVAVQPFICQDEGSSVYSRVEFEWHTSLTCDRQVSNCKPATTAKPEFVA
jgi:hypothetical protein